MFGSTEREAFHVFRNLTDGLPVGVATGATPFSPYEKNLAARVITVDEATNLPIKIDTWSIAADSIETDDTSTISAVLAHSYPGDMFGSGYDMPSLSPSAYSAYADEIRENEDVAVAYLSGSAMGDRTLKGTPANPAPCGSVCRVNTACELGYGVNEQTLMCMGYRFPFPNALYYMMGVLENPWYTPTEDTDSS